VSAAISSSPDKKFNYCAFQAYCAYSLLQRSGFSTRENRRDIVLKEWEEGLAWAAAKVALGSDNAADRAAFAAAFVMNRLAAAWQRTIGSSQVQESAAVFELSRAVAKEVLGEGNFIVGSLLATYLVDLVNAKRDQSRALASSFIVEMAAYDIADYERPGTQQGIPDARD
jgi:hypothetical protein